MPKWAINKILNKEGVDKIITIFTSNIRAEWRLPERKNEKQEEQNNGNLQYTSQITNGVNTIKQIWNNYTR